MNGLEWMDPQHAAAEQSRRSQERARRAARAEIARDVLAGFAAGRTSDGAHPSGLDQKAYAAAAVLWADALMAELDK